MCSDKVFIPPTVTIYTKGARVWRHKHITNYKGGGPYCQVSNVEAGDFRESCQKDGSFNRI